MVDWLKVQAIVHYMGKSGYTHVYHNLMGLTALLSVYHANCALLKK